MLKDKNAPIGFFDSGIGGLSVYSEFRKLLPKENAIYYGDIKNLPYGTKTADELEEYARRILDFFKVQNTKAVVIACNTSSALVYDRIKNDYEFKIYPIIQSCAKIISEFKIKKLGVFATTGTINSHAYKKEINKFNPEFKIKEIACPEWVNLIENSKTDTQECFNNVKQIMTEMLEFEPDKIILGCTHYPCLLKILNKFTNNNNDFFVNPSLIFANYIQNDLMENNLINNEGKGDEVFYVSACPEQFSRNAGLFYSVSSVPLLA